MTNWIASDVNEQLAQASWIRRMFEAGRALKAREGEDRVYDFSLGNPSVPPPEAAAAVLRALADRLSRPGALGYAPNAGRPALRERLAAKLGAEQGVELAARHVTVTCGAAGALCVLFRTVLEAGDEVLSPAPCFPEYRFYAAHFGARFRTVATRRPGYALDVAALCDAIGPATRIVLIDSPNNPTGAVYDAQSLETLAAHIATINRQRERPVLLVSDEPYRALVYDGVVVPPILSLGPFAVVAGSFSKSLSLAGERIGYLAVHPDMPEVERFGDALTLNMRTLGYVNAPLIGQMLAEALLDSPPPVPVYAACRAAMMEVLSGAGIAFTPPRGAFYIFPDAPGGDDEVFVNRLLEERILAVPGRGFGAPGAFRLSFAVNIDTIRASAEGFRRAVERSAPGE